MLDQRFVVDEAGFQFHDESVGNLESTLLRFLDVLEYANATGRGVVRWSEVWHVEAASGRTLWELLYVSTNIDRDVRHLFGGRLDKVGCWDNDEDLQPPMSVLCEDRELPVAPSIGLCLMAEKHRLGLACLTTDQARRQGPMRATSVDPAYRGTVQFLVDADDGRGFWRSTIALEDLLASGLALLSPLAFPRIRFAPTTWSQVSRFEGSYRDVRPSLVRDLSGLDDHALEVWQSHAEPARISAEMAARAGVECSRDSPKTHANLAAMAERRADFGGMEVICEWHTKLEPHRNRIHFAVTRDQVLVGIFTDHLTT